MRRKTGSRNDRTAERMRLTDIENSKKLPDEYRHIMYESDADRAVCDYISGMSDEYAVDLYTDLFVPKFWK